MGKPEIIYDDASLTVIDKPAGWVVHEGAGETGETIVDWFVKNFPEVTHHHWPDPTRIGIVHRLDKNTSGVMVLAKSPAVLADLQEQFAERTTKKVYQAVVFGVPKEKSGRIETFIGRHPKRRLEQTVLPIQIGDQVRREAIADYEVTKELEINSQPVALITFYPKTGRMHQLRLQAKYLGTPILGDPVYSIKPSKKLSKALGLDRQLLHAVSLTFRHPTIHKRMTFKSPRPKEFDL